MLGPIQVSRAVLRHLIEELQRHALRGAPRRRHRSHSFQVTNGMCGDPAHGDRKTLEVTYQCGQRDEDRSAREHQTIFLDCNS
jgi:hypothetical protein